MLPAQHLAGGGRAPAQVVGPRAGLDIGNNIMHSCSNNANAWAGDLSGEVVVDAGVLHLLPGPAVLHHARELLLHARHVARAVARAARRAAQEVLKQQVPLVYGLQMIFYDCKLKINRMIDIHRPLRLRQVGSTGGCCCTG